MEVIKIHNILNISNTFQSEIPERLKLSAKDIQKKYLPPEKPNLLDSIDEYLNLSHRKLNNFFKIIESPKSEETDKILKTINKLIKRGVVGYEYLNIKNRPYKSYLSTGLVSPYSHAKIYRKPDLNQKLKSI